jgi:hypothetical protein
MKVRARSSAASRTFTFVAARASADATAWEIIVNTRPGRKLNERLIRMLQAGTGSSENECFAQQPSFPPEMRN